MKNVILDDGSEVGLDENVYCHQIIKHLQKNLPKFKDYLFILFNHQDSGLPISRNFKHDKKILIWEGGSPRRQRLDKISSDYFHIFSTHTFDRKNIHSLPLGFFTDDKRFDVIPVEERLFNIDFTGCLNRNRIELAVLLSCINKTLLSLGLRFCQKLTLKALNAIIFHRHNLDHFLFTEDFAKGYTKERYMYLLRHSKIVLCPRGWVSTETFRMYEAMKYGCVVITEKLPDRSYYKNIPVIQIDDWKKGLEIARYLLKDINHLKELSRKNIEFYNNNFDPKMVVQKMITDLTKKKSVV